MFGEPTSFGFIPSPVIGLQAGNLYNVVISLIVSLSCAYAAWNIFAKGRKSLAEKAFALFLGLIGLHWFGAAVSNALAWSQLLPQARVFGYLVKLKMVLPPVVLAYFFSKEISRSKLVERLTIYYYIFAGFIFLFTTYWLDATFHTISYWGVQWQISALARLIYVAGLLLPLAFFAIGAIIKQGLSAVAEKKEVSYTLYFGALIFILLEYWQIAFAAVTWQALLSRLLYILIAFGAYLTLVGRLKEQRFISRDEGVVWKKPFRFPYFSKLLLLFILLAVVPITVASLLMFVSFKEIIDIYIHKPLLWNLKTSREAFILALNHVQIQSVFLMLLTGLLVFVASVLVAKAIAFSLQTISLGMEKVSRGDFSFKIRPTSNDEVGDVAGYFNDMSAEIKRSREIMERWNHELEIKVAERTQDLRTLYNIAKAIGSSLDFELLLSRAIDNLLPVIKADGYCVLVPDEKGKFSARLCRGIKLDDLELKEGQGLLGEALLQKTVLYTEDLPHDPRCQEDYYKLSGLATMIVSPLRAKGKTMGMLIIGTRGRHHYTEDREVALLAAISDQLAVSLENVGIYEKEKEAVARLTELDRLKNEFISMVSHELRTPVTAADGYVSLFLAGATGPVSEDQKKYLAIIQENDQRLLTLINRLLDFSSIETGRFTIKRELVSINEVIQSVAESLKPLLEKKQAKLTLKLAAKNVNFMGDRDKMTQVFINLLENAMKFKKEEEAPRIEVSTREAGDFIEAAVSDKGIGLEKEHLEIIFNKFYQIEDYMTRKVGGVGLGLAIAKEIVGNHQGKIWAESAGRGKGAKFIFTLPVAEKV